MSDEAHDDAETANLQMTDRKISLPEQENERLEKLADDCAGGNCSQTIRRAILCYERIHDGGGEARRQRIEREVNCIRENIDQLTENLLNDDADSAPALSVEETGTEVAMEIEDESPNGTVTPSENMQPVYHAILRKHPETICLDDIISSEGLSETEVRHALVELERKGEIKTKRIGGTNQVTVQTESAQ